MSDVNPDALAAECRAKLQAMDANTPPPVYAKRLVSWRMARERAIAACVPKPGFGHRSVVATALATGWTLPQLLAYGGALFPAQPHGGEFLHVDATTLASTRGVANRREIPTDAPLIWEIASSSNAQPDLEEPTQEKP